MHFPPLSNSMEAFSFLNFSRRRGPRLEGLRRISQDSWYIWTKQKIQLYSWTPQLIRNNSINKKSPQNKGGSKSAFTVWYKKLIIKLYKSDISYYYTPKVHNVCFYPKFYLVFWGLLPISHQMYTWEANSHQKVNETFTSRNFQGFSKSEHNRRYMEEHKKFEWNPVDAAKNY